MAAVNNELIEIKNMSEKIAEREESSVRLLKLELSEDELAVLLGALNYVLDHVEDSALLRITGGERDEIEAIRDDLDLWLGDSMAKSMEDDVLEAV